jgi:single-strand DNA-binding protein
MRDLNKATILGTVTREVRTNQTAKGLSVANIPVGTVQQRQNGMEITTYHTVVCFGDLADIGATLNVGDRIFVQGQIQTDSWEKDGEKRYTTKVKASHLARCSAEAVDSPKAATNGGGEAPANFPHGGANKKVGFPYFDTERQIKWDKPQKETMCSPAVEKNGITFVCRWENEESPYFGGTVFGMREDEADWQIVGEIPNTQTVPF